MKKCIAIFLCVCVFCAFSATAFAVQEDTLQWEEEYGIPRPLREDYDSDAAYGAAFDVWFEGYGNFVIQKSQEEAARIAAEEEAHRQAAEEQAVSDAASPKPIESVGSSDGSSSQALENDSDDKYPLGSYVDPAGIVWSPDGTRLSPSPAPDTALALGPAEDDVLLSGELAGPDDLPASADPDALAVTAGLASDIAADSPVSYVVDLRPADTPVTVLEGLKALVTSIFGEYTPVTTTSVVTQTVGNDTYQYLLETVAPGAAGVDYEWLAGVVLFGILLFCLMKLLGGVLK